MNRFQDIRNWASDRNLIEGSDRFRQMVKLVEEFGELGEGLMDQNEAIIADSIGDMAVVLTIIAAQSGVNVEDCMFLPDERPDYGAGKWSDAMHLVKQLGVLSSGISKGKENRIISAIGEIMCLLSVMAGGFELVDEDCIEHAWQEIKDRKGRMINGVFVKEEDL